jgi:class 3 adenylate cyclase
MSSISGTKARLQHLLQQRNEYPEQSAAIDAQIHEAFAQTHAILVLDMAGFSRLTLRYGIIHFLAMVHRLESIATPILQNHGGHLVKQDADNLFVTFADVPDAIAAAVDILKTLVAVNSGLPDSQDIYASIGIGYGEVLMIEDGDMYGSEMNLASKLGEDLARPGEILLTERAFARQANTDKTWERLEFSIAGLSLVTYKVPFFPNQPQSWAIGQLGR